MKKIKNQFGRSMLEMLGVLAVIAVLSVGSIAGFRYAMDTHHVNNFVHDVSLLGLAVATRDKTVYNADCRDYEEEGFTIPAEFAECKATYDKDELVVLTVSYNDEMPERIIQRIENRCTQDVYISAGAIQFTIGPHGWDCQLAAEESETGPEDPSDWECATANDCNDREQCLNHKCRECPDPYYTNIEEFSEICCQLTAVSWDYPIMYVDGKCIWDEDAMSDNYPDEYKCTGHQQLYSDCYFCTSFQVTDLNEGTYCCENGESKSACCAALGKFFCEKQGLCVNNAGECETSCDTHIIITDLTSPPECDCPWGMPIYSSANDDPIKAICCDWVHDNYANCCDAAGGYWTGEDSWDLDGTCLTEKPQTAEDETCIEMFDWRDFNKIVRDYENELS